MPHLVRLYIKQVVIGFALSGIFVAGLLWFNVANLWHLVSSSSAGVLAVLMMFVFNGIVFSGVQFGIVIMRMADSDPDDTGGKRQPEPVRQHATVSVPVRGDPRAMRRF